MVWHSCSEVTDKGRDSRNKMKNGNVGYTTTELKRFSVVMRGASEPTSTGRKQDRERGSQDDR